MEEIQANLTYWVLYVFMIYNICSPELWSSVMVQKTRAALLRWGDVPFRAHTHTCLVFISYGDI